MLNDYKGETPKNVITQEEHKKRPFYKKVSFWVLSALGLFFGGCSVYGLVLGYQYVQAVTQAAHIIADGQSGQEQIDSINKHSYNLNPPTGQPDTFRLDFQTSNTSGYRFYDLDGNVVDSVNPYQVYIRQNNLEFQLHIGRQGGTSALICYGDYLKNIETNGVLYEWTIVAPSNGFYIRGDFYYNPYQSGYDDGYGVGSDEINLPQSVKVLLPVGNQYSVQYKTYVDGVVDRQGQLSSSQSAGAYSTFDRSRNQTLRIDLTLPSGSRAFFLYSPSWTASYPTDENYSLRQSWAVSDVTYLPTWVSHPQIYVGVTSADVPDLTYQTISVAFDVDHWGDIKVGAYSEGYQDGYQDGEQNPTAYDSGYQAGYDQGYDDGHLVGINQGEAQAQSGQKALVNMFVTAFQQPFDQIYRFLNFNVLGLNILALFTSLLTLSIGIIIIKKVI